MEADSVSDYLEQSLSKHTGKVSNFFKKNWLLLTSIPLIFIGFFYESLFKTGVAGGGDLYNTIYPFTEFLKRSLEKGELPLWNPFVANGIPMTVFSPIFHPQNYLNLFMGIQTFLVTTYFLHFLTAFLGAYLLCRLLERSKSASLAGAVVFSLSGFFATRIYQGHIDLTSQAALIPWEFLFISKFFTTNRLYWLYLLVIPFSLQILAGHLQLLYYSLLFSALYFLGLWILKVRSSGFKNPQILGFLVFGLAVGLSLGLTSPSWLPGQLSTFYSTRAFPLSFQDAVSFTQPLEKSLLMVFPTDFTRVQAYEGINYIGLLPFILVITAIFVNRKNKAVLFFSITALFSLLVAASSQTTLFSLLYHLLPAFSQLRAHNRILIFFVMSVAVLTAFGFDYYSAKYSSLKARKGRFTGKEWALAITSGLLVLIFLIKLALPEGTPGYSRLYLQVYFPSLAVLIGSYLLFRRKKLSLFGFKVVTGILIIINLFTFGWAYLKPNNFEIPTPLDTEIATAIKKNHPDSFPKIWHDINFEDSYLPRQFNLQQFDIYEVQALGRNWLSKSYLELKNQRPVNSQDYTALLQYDIPLDKDLLRLLGVNYVLSLDPNLGDEDLRLVQQFRGTKNYGQPTTDAYLYLLSNTHPMFYSQPAKDQIGPIKTDGIQLNKYSQNSVNLTVEQPTEDNYLVFGNLYFPGWEVKVNGADQPVEVINYGLLGVKLPTGTSTVEFNFKPLGWDIAILISGFSSVIFLVLLGISLGKRKLVS